MTTRRQFFRSAGVALILCTPLIARRSYAQPVGTRIRNSDLGTPDFSALRPAAQFDAGVRPHRRGGIRLSMEKFQGGPKYLIHNYGHSGAGITLSFGCASVVVDYVETIMNLRRGTSTRTTVAVLGSGVIGLTTATELRRKWPQLPISIYAKGTPGSPTPDVTKTTSYKAGGQFEPSIIIDEYKGSNRALLSAYLRASAKRIRELEATRRAGDFGIAQRKNYTFDDENPGFDEFIPPDVVPNYRRGALPFSRILNGDGSRQIGREYSTWLINPRILLPRLAADLADRNVPRRAMTFASQQQIANLSETIIINCTGFGAKALFNDEAMVPKRGLLVRLPNARQQFGYLFSGGCHNNRISYMFARQADLVIGGTVKDNEDSEVVSQHDRAVCGRLIDNIHRVFNGQSDQCVAPDPDPLNSPLPAPS